MQVVVDEVHKALDVDVEATLNMIRDRMRSYRKLHREVQLIQRGFERRASGYLPWNDKLSAALNNMGAVQEQMCNLSVSMVGDERLMEQVFREVQMGSFR